MEPWKLEKYIRGFEEGWPRAYDTLQATHGFLGAAAFITIGIRTSNLSQWAALSATISFGISMTTLCLLSASRRLMFDMYDVFQHGSQTGVEVTSKGVLKMKRFPVNYKKRVHRFVYTKRSICRSLYFVALIATVVSIGWLSAALILILWRSVSSGKYIAATVVLCMCWVIGSLFILLPDILNIVSIICVSQQSPCEFFKIHQPEPFQEELSSTSLPPQQEALPQNVFHPKWLTPIGQK